MNVGRGDVVMTRFPHAGGTRGKKRPVVVVQSDVYNVKARHAIVAEITSNLSAANDPAFLLIDLSTPDGQASGLTQNSVVGCLFLATVAESRISAPLGKLSETIMQQIDKCLKAALALP
jgi:mRNA-degrading endonuclease toxin of MazEF toxin-antitoxin module